VVRHCARSGEGWMLCPFEQADALNEGIEEARALVAGFNRRARYAEIRFTVMRGEVRGNDEEAARALFSETERFLAEMQQGLEKLDVKRVRALCMQTLKVGQALSPEAGEVARAAVAAARNACVRIVEAGEQVAVAIDQEALDAIGKARTSFLDFDRELDVDMEEPEPLARPVDLLEEPDFTAPVMVPSRPIDFGEAV
jgi:hypothetical protein